MLWGVENLSRIPGTMGGAIMQNIGAYGVEICECVAWVEVYDMERMAIKMFLRDECMFGYRTSIFKSDRNLIVVRAALDLSRGAFPRIAYEDVKNYFNTHAEFVPTLDRIREAVTVIRTAKLPGHCLGTAGSFFKNPLVSMQEFVRLQKEFPEIKAYPHKGDRIKISAAWLLDKVVGWRGVRRGNAGVYEHQALVLVNHGGASAQEVFDLAKEMKESVFNKTGVMLEEEVVII
jgi:UDP-N-acetylmuramate dehydrogenase